MNYTKTKWMIIITEMRSTKSQQIQKEKLEDRGWKHALRSNNKLENRIKKRESKEEMKSTFRFDDGRGTAAGLTVYRGGRGESERNAKVWRCPLVEWYHYFILGLY